MSEALKSEMKTLGRVAGISIKIAALVQSGYILEGISDSLFKRDVLPEPFDVPDHIGNFAEGSLATVVSCGLIGMVACLKPRVSGTAEDFKKRAKITAAGAFLASSLVQAVGEKYGINNVIGGHNTPDMIDAAYGIAWSGVTAAATYKYAVSSDKNLREAKTQRDAEWTEWYQANSAEIDRIYDSGESLVMHNLNAPIASTQDNLFVEE